MDAPVYPETKLFLSSRTKEYADVYTYSFKPEAPVQYQAGQYGHLRLSGMPEGVKAVREFSFVSAPFETEIKFGVDAKSGSPYQKRLLELSEGDAVGLFKIKGHMTWPPEVSHVVSEALSTESLGRHENEFSRRSSLAVVMIAGGIGVTPFRSMLADKKRRGLPLSVTLIHINGSEFLYGEELARLADEYIAANRDSFKSAILDAVTHAKDAHFYIAGSPGFTESVQELLASRNISRIEADPFKGITD